MSAAISSFREVQRRTPRSFAKVVRAASRESDYDARVLASARSILLIALALSALIGCGGNAVGSVGAVIGVDNETGAVHVREIREGLAAEKAGLLPEDEVLMIDGVYARDLGAARLRERLRGEVGSSVDLTIVRGDRVLRVKLVREALGESKGPPPPKEERIAP